MAQDWNYWLPQDATIWGSIGRGLGGVGDAFANVMRVKQYQDRRALENVQVLFKLYPDAPPVQKQKWISDYESQVGKNKFFDRSAFHFPTTAGDARDSGTDSAAGPSRAKDRGARGSALRSLRGGLEGAVPVSAGASGRWCTTAEGGWSGSSRGRRSFD
jgi:hypothetical protein